MSEQELLWEPPDTAETRLTAELPDCHRNSLAKEPARTITDVLKMGAITEIRC
jgi:hypothetical protein